MKNITLSVDEGVLRKVRRYAAKADTSVNALVREHLSGIAEREDRGAEVRRRLRELSESSPARLGAKTWTRDDLHGR